MTLLRAICIALGLALIGLIIWAFGAASFWASFGLITADPWGKVTLADLYLGFLMTSIMIVVIERDLLRSIGLLIALFFLGNVVTALWFAWRLPRLVALARK